MFRSRLVPGDASFLSGKERLDELDLKDFSAKTWFNGFGDDEAATAAEEVEATVVALKQF